MNRCLLASTEGAAAITTLGSGHPDTLTNLVTRATTAHERAQIHPFPNKKISLTVKNHWRNVVRCRIASNAAFCEDHPEYVRYVY